MGFNLEGKRKNEVNETPEVKIDSKQLSETEETAENYDDCALNEVQNNKGNEVNAESLEEAEDNYDDCAAKIDEMEEDNPELAEEDDDYDDCGKKTEGQYVAEVTYTTDGEVSEEEAGAELQEAYNECDDPEDMQQLKENANENEHIEVHTAEVVERPANDEISDEVAEAEYEKAQEELDEAQENLEAQQESAHEYQEDLENQINNHEDTVPEGTENINNEAPETVEETEEADKVEEITEDTENSSEAEGITEETESSDEIEESDEGTENSGEIEETTEENENSDEVKEDAEEAGGSSEIKETTEKTESSDEIKETADETGNSNEGKETVRDTKDSDEVEETNEDAEGSSKVEEVTEETEGAEAEEIGTEDLENMEDGSTVETSEIDEENLSENVSQEVEEESNTEPSEEAKEQISEEVSENTSENLPNDEADAMAEEEPEAIKEIIEEKAEEQEVVDSVEETADELEDEKTEQLSEQSEQSLQERIDGAFGKEDVTASEINNLRDEHSAELQAKIEEKNVTEAELKTKFDEVLSKEKGTDEYRQSLQEYNALQDKKSELDEQIATMEERQNLLDKKSIELREAQIQKGSEAMAASTATLVVASMLQERYDQSYYDAKPDKTELASIRDESCSAIKELSAEKDSIKQAMDAKMDEIAEYVTSNNMDRYDTAHDLRYQQLSAEYNVMKESYDRIGYSIVKLDENNKSLSEHLGDEYVSMAELSPASRISEVNTGTDIPGETNYFVDEAKASEVLSPFKQEKWEQLSVQEKKQAVEKLADYNAEILGVEDNPKIVFFNKPPKDGMVERGYYDQNNNSIFINEYCLNDSESIADTVSHEYRHKYQHQRADKLENERDLAFRENFDNYQSPGNDYASYMAYRNQLVEVDARAYGQIIRDKIGSTENSNESTALAEHYESASVDFSENNPKKGAVFDKVAINEIAREIDDRDSEVKNFKELRSSKEVFEAQEIAEIKEQVAPAYENGVEVAKKIDDGGFDTYKEHNDLESGHIEKVREKSIEAADILSEHFTDNNYNGLYSSNIDYKTVEMMAIYHDTGMDANIDAEKFNGELSAKQIRDAHSLQSAIHALRDRDFIESKSVNADEVALGCLLHSKSNSGVSNLSSAEQWETAISRLKQGVDDFNKANPSERITFDTSFIMNEDGSLKPKILAQLRSESLALRIGDANGHDSKSDVSQSGKDIKFDLRNCEVQNCEYSAETITKIEEADRSGLLSEVEHSDVYVGDKLLTNKDDESGISRAFSLGEGNFKDLSFAVVEGKPSEIVQLGNCDAYPLSTQFCIEERIREINTAKIDDDYVPERLPGMSDEDYSKLRTDCANQTAKIDSQIIIDLPNASDTTLKSYKNFAAKMAQKYNIEVKVR